MRYAHVCAKERLERVHRDYWARSAVGITLIFFLSVTSLFASQRENETTKAGPVYVPLDSWVYPALRKLAAMGYVPDEEGLAAPWTRSECLTLVKEAEDIASRHSTKVAEGPVNDDAQKLIAALDREFSDETDRRPQVRIESIYTRLLQTSGQPLQDSYHFGQTIVNDFGRPDEAGTNTVAAFRVSELSGASPATFAESTRNLAQGRPIVTAYSNCWAPSMEFRLNRRRE